MRHTNVLNRPAKAKELDFDEWYQIISEHWEQKARRLQARRWRELKEKLAMEEEDETPDSLSRSSGYTLLVQRE